MRITFVLPNPIRIPMGGAKVVYEHARGLVARGHAVKVVAPKQASLRPVALARRAAVAVRDRLHGVANTHAYAASGVETIDLPHPSPEEFPEADVTVATGVQTVPWVARLSPEAGRGVYFVQGDETFVRPDARDSWHEGLPLLTCATWLAEEMRSAGLQPLATIPNAIDPTEFGLDVPLEARPERVIALYHRHPVKGPDVLLDALAQLKRERPGAGADVFAARPPSHALPDWVNVLVRPSARHLRALYNGAAVLLHTSRSEGWPLVPMEAAACGTAVAATRNRGIQEYLTPEVTMAAVASGDGVALGNAAARLLTESTGRIAMARRAQEAVRRTSWRLSTDALEEALKSLAA